jgi:hypothetical protein
MRDDRNTAGELERQRTCGTRFMSASYLVQILLPKETGNGEPVSQEWFGAFLKELTAEFGGATSFVRSPGQGLWREGGETKGDTIAVVEVMAEELALDYWGSLRGRLERELSQDEIVIRAQKITRLMKAALEAWGASSNLFHQGFAKESDDSDVIATAMAKPGIVLKRPVGSNKPFREDADLPTAASLDLPRIKEEARPKKAKAPKPRKHDEKAERLAAAAFEKERSRREKQREKEEAAAAKAREKRMAAMQRAEAALDERRSATMRRERPRLKRISRPCSAGRKPKKSAGRN